MPITQDRMITLIQAARDYQDALESVRLYILRQCKATRSGLATPQESLDYLELITDPVGLLRDPLNSAKTIATEESHFRSTAGRNRANAKWNAERRKALGIAPRNKQNVGALRREIELAEPFYSTAPQSVARKGNYKGSIDDIINAEEAGQPLPALSDAAKAAGRPEPKRIGPANAPGLYDPPEEDMGSILGSSGRTEAELEAAIKADLERDEALARWNELNGQKAKPEIEHKE